MTKDVNLGYVTVNNAKGTLISGDGKCTFGAVPPGTAGTVLTADPTAPLGVRWGGGGGSTIVEYTTIGVGTEPVTTITALPSTCGFITIRANAVNAAAIECGYFVYNRGYGTVGGFSFNGATDKLFSTDNGLWDITFTGGPIITVNVVSTAPGIKWKMEIDNEFVSA